MAKRRKQVRPPGVTTDGGSEMDKGQSRPPRRRPLLLAASLILFTCWLVFLIRVAWIASV